MGTLYGIAYTADALRDLAAIQPKKVRQQIKNKIDTLASNPHPQGSAKVQGAMDGLWEVFRIRQGEYRALYSVRGETEIVVLHIGHRKHVYRRYGKEMR